MGGGVGPKPANGSTGRDRGGSGQALPSISSDPAEKAQAEPGPRLNVDPEPADEGSMSEVDATRTLAREHDLEFVDLDSCPVDPETATVLSEAIARRHQVVAIKRKFGIPVIAVANPDDIFAMDTLRASMGRDFTVVVASREQIVRFLDRLYGGAAGTDVPTPTVSKAPAATDSPDNPTPATHHRRPRRTQGRAGRCAGYLVARADGCPRRHHGQPWAVGQWTHCRSPSRRRDGFRAQLRMPIFWRSMHRS